MVRVQYCWWKKSCTSWDVVYPSIYRVLYIPGGYIPGGDRRISEPSTVPPHQVKKIRTSAIENIWDASHSLLDGITLRGIPNISLQVVTVFWEGFRIPMFIIYIYISYIILYIMYIYIYILIIIYIYIYQQKIKSIKSPRGVIIRPSNLDPKLQKLGLLPIPRLQLEWYQWYHRGVLCKITWLV